jgi:hypothetical protein
LITSGTYHIEKDCYGKSSPYIGEYDLSKVSNAFTSNIFVGNGDFWTQSKLRFAGYPTSDLTEGKVYSVYMKDAFLQNNIVILCGTY